MEVIIDLFDLSDVLILHLSPGRTLPARLFGITEDDLIDDDIVNVNIELSQFNSKSLSFIQTQELGNADSHKGSLLRILELLIDAFNLLLCGIKCHEQLLLSFFILTRVGLAPTHHTLELIHHWTKLLLQLDQLQQTLFQNVWEVK